MHSPARASPDVGKLGAPPPETGSSFTRKGGAAARAHAKAGIDTGALALHLAQQPWFRAGSAIASVEVVAQQPITVAPIGPPARHLLATVRATFADGTTERFVAPLSIDAQGNISDGLASPAFKRALVDAVAAGTSFEPTAAARTGAPAAPAASGRPRGWLGAMSTKAALERPGPLENGTYDATIEAAELAAAVAAHGNNPPTQKPGGRTTTWAAFVEKGYTTPERHAHVVAQAKKLSPGNADALVVEFFKNVARTLDHQPESVKAFHQAVATQPKFGPVFYGYTQFIGTPEGKSTSTFDDLVGALDIIQGPLSSMQRSEGKVGGLGFRQLELLPFFSSPQKDGGYDISNHAQVAAEVGGDPAFARFMGEAVKRGMQVTADLVANHVSNEHAWVSALLDGDTSMLSRFVVWDDAVKVGERVVDDKTFNVFLHTKGEDAGKVSHVWQIFPDNNPDTMIEAKSSDGTHNVFASFMNPYQWDVNAADPQVLSHYLEVIGHFANLGQMGTRMDAIVHMGKKAGTFNINNPESQAFMALTKAFASHVAPGNVFLPEANLPWDEAKKDWLDPQVTFGGKVENVAGDALISFDVHRAIWDSLLRGDKGAWLKVQDSLGELPANKSLLVYLGLHDETLIEDPALRQSVIDKGAHDFGGRGVGDSPAALLDGDADRLAMAHALLYSSKGHPAVYYRTLVGAPNDTAYFEGKTQERMAAQVKAGEKPDLTKSTDARDLDRGPVAKADYERALATGYKPAMMVRALNALWDRNGAVRTNQIAAVANDQTSVVSLARTSTETADPPLLQLVNLSGEKQTVVMSKADLSRQLGSGWTGGGGELKDLLASELAGAPRTLGVRVRGDQVTLDLAPYQAAYLQHG